MQKKQTHSQAQFIGFGFPQKQPTLTLDPQPRDEPPRDEPKVLFKFISLSHPSLKDSGGERREEEAYKIQ